MNRNPLKKPRKSKKVKLLLTEKDKWKRILRQVEASEAPINMMGGVSIHLLDGSHIMIDVQEMLDSGMTADELEDDLNSKLFELDNLIDSVDFLISIDLVAQAVQPATDQILKNIL